MTSEEYDLNELRIKVAELDGWHGPYRRGNVHLHGFKNDINYEDHVPDYLNDQNAMNEAFKNMDFIEATIYINYIYENSSRTGIIYPFRAPIDLQAKAFIYAMREY